MIGQRHQQREFVLDQLGVRRPAEHVRTITQRVRLREPGSPDQFATCNPSTVRAHSRLGQKADISECPTDIRFTPQRADICVNLQSRSGNRTFVFCHRKPSKEFICEQRK
jgi:hypothetical protein